MSANMSASGAPHERLMRGVLSAPPLRRAQRSRARYQYNKKVTGDSSQEEGWWGEVGGWVGAGKEEEEQKGFLGF